MYSFAHLGTPGPKTKTDNPKPFLPLGGAGVVLAASNPTPAISRCWSLGRQRQSPFPLEEARELQQELLLFPVSQESHSLSVSPVPEQAVRQAYKATETQENQHNDKRLRHA
jgi:hypothetical protein